VPGVWFLLRRGHGEAFPKGVRSGLCRKYSVSLLLQLGAAILASGGSFLLAAVAYGFAQGKHTDDLWFLGPLAIGVAAIVAAVFGLKTLALSVRDTLRLARVRWAIRNASEVELLDWTREAYRENHESLSCGDTWLQILALHAR
jgi:hypothetical protein